MMFKIDWEKTGVIHQLPQGAVERMARAFRPDKELLYYQLIAGGCVNLNVKIHFKNDEHPLILRVYLRDKTAASKEQKISALLQPTVPTPHTYYIGKIDGYHFAITEFINGITLRDLLLSDIPYDISAVMEDVGVVLSKITIHEFLHSGFFDKELNVISRQPLDDYLVFAKQCIEDEIVISTLKPETISKIKQIIYKYGYLLPSKNEKNLVHADFDPANILVNEVDGVWRVSGVLDWEFAFSGSMLCDIANMLRYAHKMPPEFQNAFLKGLTDSGITLPHNWCITIHLLNLLSLLDCLKRSDTRYHFNKCADIGELIDYIVSDRGTFILLI